MDASARLLIDEQADAAGAFVRTTLETFRANDFTDATTVRVRVGDEAVGVLDSAAVAAVMRRFGRPLEEGIVPRGESLVLGDGCRLQRMRHLARYDVIARDYLVWFPATKREEPLTELSTRIAAALVHLARARGG